MNPCAGLRLLTILFGALMPAIASAQPMPLQLHAGHLRQALHLAFSLQVDAEPSSRGTLWLDRHGQTCLWVQEPLQQRMWLASEGLSIYYPAERTLLRQVKAKPEVPAMLDALLVGLRSPAEVLPNNAKLIARERTPQGTWENWQIEDPQGRPLAKIRALETAQGPKSVEISDADAQHVRTYRFGPPQRVGALSVPTTADTEVLHKQAVVRKEHWTFKVLPGGTPPAGASQCLGAAADARVQVLP